MTDAPLSPDRLDPAAAAEDLAFLKRMAVAGRGRPAPFLPLMAVFGGGYGLAEFVVWCEQVAFNDGRFFPDVPAPGVWSAVNGVLFITAHLAFFGTLLWTAWRLLQTRAAEVNRAAAAAWSAAFGGLVTTIVCVGLVAYTVGRADPAPDVIRTLWGDQAAALTHTAPCFILILWGAAWWVTAWVTDRRWLCLVSLGSIAAALSWASLIDSGLLKLVSALSLLLLAFLPALLLLLQDRARHS